MEYLLRKNVLVAVPEVHITRDEFETLKAARRTLREAFSIEEKYEVLIRSYLEFENHLLAETNSRMVRDYFGYQEVFEIRLKLNICITNLLTSARMYVDQFGRHVRDALSGGQEVLDTVKSFFSAEYDAHRGYRFMEALRNHVQHHGLPIHSISTGGGWTSLGADGLLEFSVELATVRDSIVENEDFKASVLEEMPQNVDLKVATRRYIESFSNIQQKIRQLVDPAVDKARKVTEEACHRYAEVCNYNPLVGLSAWQCDESGNTCEEVPLVLEWDDIRIALRHKNGALINLARRYVTGRPRKET